MGILKAIGDSVNGTLADQWKDIITAGNFDEQTVVAPGVLNSTNRGRGTNYKGSENIISNGSKIFVPENTVAFIFGQSAIENMITESGSYEYQDGEASIFNGDGIGESLFGQAWNRIGFGGISKNQKWIVYVNMREIRNIKFGTRGPQVYHDFYYESDLEIRSFGSFTIKVMNPEKLIKNFVPPNMSYYSFDSDHARGQIIAEFLQSFTVALNDMSSRYRIAQLPSQSNEIAKTIIKDTSNAGTWEERFGFKIIGVAIENIEFTEKSRELVQQFSSEKMGYKVYDGISKETSDIAAQQKISEGVRDNGLGDGGGMIFGMNMAQGITSQGQMIQQTPVSFDEQVENLKKLKDLLDTGILTQEEFDQKKKEVMGL